MTGREPFADYPNLKPRARVMTGGSCLCGAVRWSVDDGAFTRMTHCHCSMCRKAHGAPFATYATAPRDRFRWDQGESRVTWFESSAGSNRAFCAQCGSVVPDGSEQSVYVPAGCLDDDPGLRPSAHIFASSKAPWHVIEDDLPRYETYSSDGAGPVVERPSSKAGRTGALRGSCLCGGVAYEITTPITAVYNCHCSRCRKARAAAHTTNGFTAADGVTFVRGGDSLQTFRLPGARYFTQVFCPACGSGMPRIDSERGIAVIPFGSLDDDPGCGAACHIFVEFMAPWYALAGSIPQYPAGPPA